MCCTVCTVHTYVELGSENEPTRLMIVDTDTGLWCIYKATPIKSYVPGHRPHQFWKLFKKIVFFAHEQLLCSARSGLEKIKKYGAKRKLKVYNLFSMHNSPPARI